MFALLLLLLLKKVHDRYLISWWVFCAILWLCCNRKS